MKRKSKLLLSGILILAFLLVWTQFRNSRDYQILFNAENYIADMQKEAKDKANDSLIGNGQTSVDTSLVDADTLYTVEESEVVEENALTDDSTSTSTADAFDTMEFETNSEWAKVDHSKYYAYSKLSTENQNFYAQIYDALLYKKVDVLVATKDPVILDKAFQCVMLDHPELFYVDGYKYVKHILNGETIRITVTGNYTMTDLEITKYRKEIDTYKNNFFGTMPASLDTYGKVKYTYEYIVNNTEYALNAPNNQNIVSVFSNHQSVCQGYAKAFQYLLYEMQIPCELVLGSANGEGHAFNLVKINGAYYYVDPTWGEASYLAGNSIETNGIMYDYLCVTTEFLLKTHQISMPIEMPVCTATEANYYVRENAYFTAMDTNKMAQLFQDGYTYGKTFVVIKCDTVDTLHSLIDELITNNKIFSYMKNQTASVSYSVSEENYTITVWL